MAKLRKIKTGSALSPPDNRAIAQKQMRSRYIRTIKKRRIRSGNQAVIPVRSGIQNTTFRAGQTNVYKEQAEIKIGSIAKWSYKRERYYDTSSYTGGKILAEKRYAKRQLAQRSHISKDIIAASNARVLNTALQNTVQGSSGDSGSPDEYAESQVGYAGQGISYRAGSTLRSAVRQKHGRSKDKASVNITPRGRSMSGQFYDIPTNTGSGVIPYREISMRQRMRLAADQYMQDRRFETVKTGISGMLQSARKAIKAMAEASKSTAAAISIAGIGSTVVLVIVSVVLVLAMTISSSFGEYGLELSDNDLVNIALSQVGNESGEEYCKWYGFDHEVGWCAIFVSWCGTEAGLVKKDLMPKFAWVPTGVYWFQNRDQWHANDYTPKPGDIIFFDWYDYDLDDDGEEIGQDGQADHVGIVEKVEAGRVYTVEGNTTQDSICAEKHYPLGYFEILGYGEILYP